MFWKNIRLIATKDAVHFFGYDAVCQCNKMKVL